MGNEPNCDPVKSVENSLEAGFGGEGIFCWGGVGLNSYLWVMVLGIIGAGGVGQTFAKRLSAIGHTVYLVHRPHQVIEGAFAQLTQWEALPWESLDAVLLCVRDQQIAPLAREIQHTTKTHIPIAHTAGSVDIEALSGFARRGVVYPLQTFSPGVAINWGEFPVFWEGDELFFDLAVALTGTAERVHYADSLERLRLHIGAVFVANFTNAMADIAQKVVSPRWDFRVYLPLLEAVVGKLHVLSPGEAQTGPARRGDVETLQKHLSYLEAHWPALAPLYEMLSRYIRDQSLQ